MLNIITSILCGLACILNWEDCRWLAILNLILLIFNLIPIIFQ